MSIIKYIDRLNQIDQLIRLKSTGTPKELAEKLNISEALLYKTLNEMKELGAPICYDKVSSTYYYSKQIGLELSFKPIHKQ